MRPYVFSDWENQTVALHKLLHDEGFPLFQQLSSAIAVQPLEPVSYERYTGYIAPTMQTPQGDRLYRLRVKIADFVLHVIDPYLPEATAAILSSADQRLTPVSGLPENMEIDSRVGQCAFVIYVAQQLPQRRLPLLLGAAVEVALAELFKRTQLPSALGDRDDGHDALEAIRAWVWTAVLCHRSDTDIQPAQQRLERCWAALQDTILFRLDYEADYRGQLAAEQHFEYQREQMVPDSPPQYNSD